jgi:hypothetical protein
MTHIRSQMESIKLVWIKDIAHTAVKKSVLRWCLTTTDFLKRLSWEAPQDCLALASEHSASLQANIFCRTSVSGPVS